MFVSVHSYLTGCIPCAVVFPSFTSPSSCISENCTLHRKQHQQPPPPSPPTFVDASAGDGGGGGCSSPSHEPKEKRVHFDLETLHSYRLRTHTASVRGRPGMVGRPGLGLGGLGLGLGSLGRFSSPPSISLHANGGPVSTLASSGLVLGSRASQTSMWEGELQDLQGKIEMFRTQLREALARRAEIQTSLERERSGLVRRDTSLERERQRVQTISTDRSSGAQPKLPERDRTSQLQTLNNQQAGLARANQPGAPGGLSAAISSTLERGRAAVSANQLRGGDRTVHSRTATSLERIRLGQPPSGGPAPQSRNTSSLDRQKANLSSTLERTKANQSSASSGGGGT